jgi:hypothetical protein
MPCSAENCPNEAFWQPVLELRSAKKGPITTGKLTQLVYCEEHKKISTLTNFLSDEAFVKIAKFMRENGKKAPAQRNITLTWFKLSPEMLETMSPLTIAESDPDDDLAF